MSLLHLLLCVLLLNKQNKFIRVSLLQAYHIYHICSVFRATRYCSL